MWTWTSVLVLPVAWTGRGALRRCPSAACRLSENRGWAHSHFKSRHHTVCPAAILRPQSAQNARQRLSVTFLPVSRSCSCFTSQKVLKLPAETPPLLDFRINSTKLWKRSGTHMLPPPLHSPVIFLLSFPNAFAHSRINGDPAPPPPPPKICPSLNFCYL